MLICFFDSHGIVKKEFAPPGQTVNKQYYREVLEWLRKRVHRVWPEIADTWTLHHDNASCHTVISVNEFLAKKKVFQWFRSHHTRLIWVRVTSSFSQNSNSTSKVIIWNCGQHPKGRDRPAEDTSTWRLPALLPGVGATSPAVCGFPKGTTLKGIMLIYRFKKKNIYIAPVSLLSWRTTYILLKYIYCALLVEIKTMAPIMIW